MLVGLFFECLETASIPSMTIINFVELDDLLDISVSGFLDKLR